MKLALLSNLIGFLKKKKVVSFRTTFLQVPNDKNVVTFTGSLTFKKFLIFFFFKLQNVDYFAFYDICYLSH